MKFFLLSCDYFRFHGFTMFHLFLLCFDSFLLRFSDGDSVEFLFGTSGFVIKSLVTQIQQQRPSCILTLFVAGFSSSGKRLEPSGKQVGITTFKRP